jgi:2Fe-2S ferredoxin
MAVTAKTVKITYVAHDGVEHKVDVPLGWSVMEGAVRQRVPGIDADCGGACACATCHVYVDPAWGAALPPKSEMEETMLDFALARKPESRLSCQLRATSDMEGLILRLPVSQH